MREIKIFVGFSGEIYTETEARQLPPLALAYIGDSFFSYLSGKIFFWKIKQMWTS